MKKAAGAESVARRLERAIQSGQFKPGKPLPAERVLAEKWRISRPVVREGIAILAARGLLTRRHGSGTYVNDVSEQFGAQVWNDMSRRHPDLSGGFFEFRHMLECRAAELAARRHDARDRERLVETAAAVDAAFAAVDREERLRADMAFHHAIAEATHNPVFVYLMTSLQKLLHEHMLLTVAGNEPRSSLYGLVREQHKRLLAAILARDVAAAGKAAGAHIDFVRVKLNHMPE